MVATYATPGEETPTRIGSAGKVVAGYDVCVLPLQKDEAGGGGGDSSSSGEDVTEDGHKLGNLVVKLPLPPGCATTLWNNSEGYHKSYLEKFPGYFDLTDAGYIDNDGYVYVMSRTDDVINVAGHRLSTAAIEQVLSSNQQVAEVAVVTIRDQLKGERPVGVKRFYIST